MQGRFIEPGTVVADTPTPVTEQVDPGAGNDAQDTTQVNEQQSQAFDPSILPDDARKAYEAALSSTKEMERGYQKKFEELAQDRKQAEIFRQLVADPKARAEFLKMTGQNADPGTHGETSFENPYKRSVDDELKEEHAEAVKHAAYNEAMGIVQKLVIPAIREVVAYKEQIAGELEQLLAERREGSMTSALAKYPGAEKFTDEIKAFRSANPKASWEQAAKAVLPDDVLRAQPSANGRERQAAVARTGVEGRSASSLSKNGAAVPVGTSYQRDRQTREKSTRDLVQEAMDQLGFDPFRGRKLGQ